MKKRIAVALTALIMLLSFASCGQSNTVTTTATTSAIQVTSAAEIPTTASPETTTSQTSETTTKANLINSTTAMATTVQPTTAVPTTKAPTTKTPTTKVTTAAAPTTEKITTFTSAELANFDGKNGSLAYIAYEGTVYNVTGPNWENGVHYTLKAGKDITAAYNFCGKHGSTIFNKYPTVGTFIG